MILEMNLSRRRSFLIALAGAGCALALASPALAEDPVDTQYGNGASKISQQLPQVVSQSATPSSSAPTSPSSVPPSSNSPASTHSAAPAPTSTKPATTTAPPSNRAVAAAGDEVLPLTGLDLGFAVAIGIVAAVAGLALRRAGRNSTS